ncbi:MAG: cation diffusion facilitator family transporter [Anaerovoracaceae bacterium]
MTNFLFKTFIKDYENTGDPAVRERYGNFAGIVGIISNVFLCTIKILIGFIANSIAIIADGFNNLADASSSVITLVGFRLAAIPEDEEHPYGHARIEYLTGLLVSAIIIVLGFQLLKTSFVKILNPEPSDFSMLTLAVLVLAILIKVWQALFYVAAGKRINSVALTATGADSRNDVIATTAVLISAVIGKFTDLQLDGIMGCVVALFIIWSGIQLVRETSSPLLGEAPDPELVDSILKGAAEHEGVIGTHDLMVHNYGPGRIFASIHIEIDADSDIMESHDMIDNIERELSRDLKIHLVVHMDPVKLNDPLVNDMRKILGDTIAPIEGVYGLHDLRVVPGPTHTNIIFDVVMSPECKVSQDEIKDILTERVKRENENYYLVITFDMAYTRPADANS